MQWKTILGIIGVLVIGVLVVVYFFSQKISPSESRNATGPDQYAAAILACYSKNSNSNEDRPISNNSIQYVKETSRRFINMPKNLYPKDISHSWDTVSGNATAGYVSNGGLPGEAQNALSGCWSTYVDFEGSGEVDLHVKSTIESVPDYFVRFFVSPT